MGLFDRFKNAGAPTPTIRPRIAAAPSSPGSALSDDQRAVLPEHLRQSTDSAKLILRKKDLLGERAAVYAAVDRSLSMTDMWSDGTMGDFLVRALAVSAHFDDDGSVPVFGFGSTVKGPIDIDLKDAERAVSLVNRECGGLEPHTLYAPAIRAITKAYLKDVSDKSRVHDGPAAPGFVIFQTDGDAHDPDETKKALIEASQYPIFFQFVGFGKPSAESFTLLSELDDLDGRVIDNAGFYWAGTDPHSTSDSAMFDGLMSEFPEYLPRARKAFGA